MYSTFLFVMTVFILPFTSSPTVQVFTETMSKKKEGISEMEKLADELRKVDGVKKNGTSDVDSRYSACV